MKRAMAWGFFLGAALASWVLVGAVVWAEVGK